MQLARNSLYSGASMALPIIVSIATVPVYIATIGAERYGALAIAWVLLGYFGQLDFGIGRAVTQRISGLADRQGAQAATIVWSALASVMVFGLAGGGAVSFGASYFFSGPFDTGDALRGELLASVWALALCNPLVSVYGVAAGALMGVERFRLVSAAGLIGNMALQIVPLITAMLAGPDLTYLILASLGARMLGLGIVAAGMARTFLAAHPVRLAWDEVRQLTNFGVWIMVSAFVGPLMMFADRFVIGAYLGAAAVAAYTIPFQIAYRTQIFPAAVSQVLFPRFAAESASASRQRCEQYAVFIGQIFAPVIAGLICLAGPLLHLWLGRHLDPRSVQIAQVLLAGIWINAIAQVPFSYVQARGNSRFTAMLHLCELPAYVLALAGLGSAFGLIGMAAAFSLRCLVDWIALSAKAGLLTGAVLSRLIGPAALVLIPVFLGQRLGEPMTALLAAAFVCFLACAFAVLQMPLALRSRIAQLPGAGLVPGLRRGLEGSGGS